MREGERIEIGQAISFPCHVARVGQRIQSPCAPPLHAGLGIQRAEERHAAAGCATSGAGRAAGSDPWPPHRHAGPNNGVEVLNGHRGGAGTPNSPPSTTPTRSDSHLAYLFGHLWERYRVSSSSPPPPRDSFGWWRGKVGGDDRSFAQVAEGSKIRLDPSKAMGDQGGGRFGGRRDFPGRGGFGGGRRPPPPN